MGFTAFYPSCRAGRKKEAEVLINQALQKRPTDEVLLEFQQRVIRGQ
jgi:hypothetical protein